MTGPDLVLYVQSLWLLAGASPAEVRELSGQVAQESAWRPAARSRYAAGLAQFTPATAGDWWPKVGCANADILRVDCQARAQRAYMQRLKAANARSFDYRNKLDFALAAYNGGLGWIRREQRTCRIKPGCDPRRFEGHVRTQCMRAAWACTENGEYPSKVRRRMLRYDEN